MIIITKIIIKDNFSTETGKRDNHSFLYKYI